MKLHWTRILPYTIEYPELSIRIFYILQDIQQINYFWNAQVGVLHYISKIYALVLSLANVCSQSSRTVMPRGSRGDNDGRGSYFIHGEGRRRDWTHLVRRQDPPGEIVAEPGRAAVTGHFYTVWVWRWVTHGLHLATPDVALVTPAGTTWAGQPVWASPVDDAAGVHARVGRLLLTRHTCHVGSKRSVLRTNTNKVKIEQFQS